jgi:hypothetical protein
MKRYKIKKLDGTVLKEFEAESDENELVQKYIALNGQVKIYKNKHEFDMVDFTIESEVVTEQELQVRAVAAAVQAAINKGNAIIAKVSARNAMKQINTAQTLAFVQAFGGIAQLLQLGALETAKDQVMAIQPNELVTQEDLDFVLGLLAEAIGG